MVIKMLSAKANFAGIDYSERKNKKGKSELLVARNFDAIDTGERALGKEDYLAYMRMIAGTNPAVKNKQFHAVLSTKDREHSPEQLALIAEQYLKEMGYGKNPYLIYYHSDTDNNHVHIVSTRVTPDGQKVNDRFEGVRSKKIIDRIIGQNPALEYDKHLKESLTYNFSSETQFRLLMEVRGYIIKDESGMLTFIKHGSVQGKISKEEIKQKVNTYLAQDERMSQLKTLFHKYASLYSPELKWEGKPLPGGGNSTKEGRLASEFSNYMKAKFGVELIFHRKGDHERPYGYSVIDHSHKQVYKGGQIMGLDDLLLKKPEAEKLTAIIHAVLEAETFSHGFNHLREELKKGSYFLSRDGAIREKFSNQPLYTIDPEKIKKLFYQDRLITAKTYKVSAEQDLQELARLYRLNAGDLALTRDADPGKAVLREKMESFLLNPESLKLALERSAITVFYSENSFYLHDSKNHVLVNAGDLLGEDLLSLFEERMQADGEHAFENDLEANTELTEFGLDDVLLSMQGVFGSIHSEGEPERKRKRKR